MDAPRGIEWLMVMVVIALILELNLGVIFKKYGSFRWRRLIAYFWLLLALHWLAVDFRNVFLNNRFTFVEKSEK